MVKLGSAFPTYIMRNHTRNFYETHWISSDDVSKVALIFSVIMLNVVSFGWDKFDEK